jgi:hypothetical protein
LHDRHPAQSVRLNCVFSNARALLVEPLLVLRCVPDDGEARFAR